MFIIPENTNSYVQKNVAARGKNSPRNTGRDTAHTHTGPDAASRYQARDSTNSGHTVSQEKKFVI
jgi:hypothetical protein